MRMLAHSVRRVRTCSLGIACGVLVLTGTAEAKMICPMGDVDGSGNGAMAAGSGPSGSDRSGSDAPLAPAGAPAPAAPAPGPNANGRPAASAPAQGSPATAVADVPASVGADVPATTSVPASTPASVPVTATVPARTTAPAPVAVSAAAPVVDVQAQVAAERAARQAAAERRAERRAARRAAARRAAARRAATAALQARMAYQASFDPGRGSAWVEPPAAPAAAMEQPSSSRLTAGLGLVALLGIVLAGFALHRRRGSGGVRAVAAVVPMDPVAAARSAEIEAELQEILAEECAARELDGLTGSGTR